MGGCSCSWLPRPANRKDSALSWFLLHMGRQLVHPAEIKCRLKLTAGMHSFMALSLIRIIITKFPKACHDILKHAQPKLGAHLYSFTQDGPANCSVNVESPVQLHSGWMGCLCENVGPLLQVHPGWIWSPGLQLPTAPARRQQLHHHRNFRANRVWEPLLEPAGGFPGTTWPLLKPSACFQEHQHAQCPLLSTNKSSCTCMPMSKWLSCRNVHGCAA